MTNTRRLIAALAIAGSMAIGSAAFAVPAAPQPAPAPAAAGEWVPPCVQYGPGMRYAGMENVLTLSAQQKPLWDKYVAALNELRTDRPTWKEPAADEQQRLDRCVERSAFRAEQLKKVRDARADLLKSLSVEQKYVLESWEHGRRGPGKMGKRGYYGPNCGYGPGYFDGPRGPHHGPKAGPRGGVGPHHGFGPGAGMGYGPGMNPNCPFNAERF